MARDVSKLKYDGEILKDLRRTFPMVEVFQSTDNLEKLRRVLNIQCIQNPSTVGYV